MKTIISDELLIAELVKHFESGTMGKQYLWELFKDVYKLQRQRFFTIYAEAHTFWAGIKNKALDEAIRENTFKGLEQSYLSKIEALCILSDIARGKVVIQEDDILIPSFSDRRAAIETMCKMEGWYATAKTETQIHSDEPPVIVINTSEKLIENEGDLTD